MSHKKGYFKTVRVGKLFRLSGLGYETLYSSKDTEENILIDFANRIKGTDLAKRLGEITDSEWYEQNRKDIENLEKGV